MRSIWTIDAADTNKSQIACRHRRHHRCCCCCCFASAVAVAADRFTAVVAAPPAVKRIGPELCCIMERSILLMSSINADEID